MTELRYYLIYNLASKRFDVTIFDSWKYNKNIELISCYDSAKVAIEETKKRI